MLCDDAGNPIQLCGGVFNLIANDSRANRLIWISPRSGLQQQAAAWFRFLDNSVAQIDSAKLREEIELIDHFCRRFGLEPCGERIVLERVAHENTRKHHGRNAVRHFLAPPKKSPDNTALVHKSANKKSAPPVRHLHNGVALKKRPPAINVVRR